MNASTRQHVIKRAVQRFAEPGEVVRNISHLQLDYLAWRKLMKKSMCCAGLAASVLSFVMTAQLLATPLLAVDFGRSTTAVQPGFNAMVGDPVMSSATSSFGSYSVTVQGEGFYSAGFNAGNADASVEPLYVDYYYHNSATNGVGIALTIAGVIPNTSYDLTLWSYDEDNIFSPTPTSWSPSGSTTGTSGSVVNFASPYPTDLSFNRTTIRVQSTTTNLEVFGTTTGGSGGTRLNGFQLDAVPEPGVGVLLVIGTLLAASCRSTISQRR
jgi:hypothetical protein